MGIADCLCAFQQLVEIRLSLLVAFASLQSLFIEGEVEGGEFFFINVSVLVCGEQVVVEYLL